MCLKLPSSRQAAGKKGEWLGCAELLPLPAGHRMRASLLPCDFRLLPSRMEEQGAWCGRDTGTDQVILNLVPMSGAMGSWGFGWSLAGSGAGWVVWDEAGRGLQEMRNTVGSRDFGLAMRFSLQGPAGFVARCFCVP